MENVFELQSPPSSVNKLKGRVCPSKLNMYLIEGVCVLLI